MRAVTAWATRTDWILDLMTQAETNGIGVREAIALTRPGQPAFPSHLPDPLSPARGRSSRLFANPDENDLRPFVVPASLPTDICPGA